MDFNTAAADLIVVLTETCIDAKSPLVSESFRQEALLNLVVLVTEFNERMIADMQANLSKLN
jgi:hypothetical protein